MFTYKTLNWFLIETCAGSLAEKTEKHFLDFKLKHWYIVFFVYSLS